MIIKLLKLSLIILLPFIIVIATINMIAINENTYMNGYDKYDRTTATGIEREDLQIITENFIEYLFDKKDDMQLTLRVRGKSRDIFNEKELKHMVDVKNLVGLGKLVMSIAIVLILLIGFYMYYKGHIKQYIQGMIIASTVSLMAIPLGYILLPKDFFSLFNIFHEILFTNDLWILNEKTDILLQLHPLNFFMDIGIKIGVIFVVVNILIITIGGLVLGIHKRQIRKIK